MSGDPGFTWPFAPVAPLRVTQRSPYSPPGWTCPAVLSSNAETTAYYEGLAAQLGRRPDRIALGQGAYLTANGSLVVRKNYKVMLIDASQLPAQFGQPPQAPSDVALSVAAIIMTCWKDA